MPSTNLDSPLLIDERQHAEILEKGFTVVPFLDPEEVQALLALHAETHATVPYDFYVSALDPYELRRRICEGIASVLSSKLNRLFPGYRLFLASFVTKKANSTHGKLQPHQDYSLTEQDKHTALNVWVPLCDVNVQNGCMRMVAYSQRFNHICATSMNPSVYSNLIPELEAHFLTDVPMTAGEALIFDARVLHATGENETPRERPAILFSLVPSDAQTLLYFWNHDVPERIEVYEADTDFLLHLPARRYPTPEEKQGARFIKYIEYAPKLWTTTELERTIPRPATVAAASSPRPDSATEQDAATPPPPTSMLGRLRNLFSPRAPEATAQK